MPSKNELLHAVVDELARRQVRYLVFSGGEPVLHPALPRLIALATDKNMICGISTNGTCLNPQTVRDLREAGLRKATVSLDGPTGDVHDAIRCAPGSFDKVIHGIRCLVEAGIAVSTNTVLNPRNVIGAQDITTLAAGLGAQVVSFTVPVCSDRNGINEIAPVLPRLWAELIDASRLVPHEVVIELHDPQCTRADCPAGRQIVGVTEHGEILPCLVKDWIERAALGFSTAPPQPPSGLRA